MPHTHTHLIDIFQDKPDSEYSRHSEFHGSALCTDLDLRRQTSMELVEAELREELSEIAASLADGAIADNADSCGERPPLRLVSVSATVDSDIEAGAAASAAMAQAVELLQRRIGE